MQGMSFATLKKHPALIPLYIVALSGGLGGASYLFRLATHSPDVTWSHSKNPEPNDAYRNKQYKFYSTRDNKQIESQAPKYKED